MDHDLLIDRLGVQIRKRRLNLGLTQAQLADLARLTRYKVIAVEKGAPSVGMGSDARVLAALDCELTVVTAVMPTLEELENIFK
jgi:transcriptional regulator with XRE-family HTH domain